MNSSYKIAIHLLGLGIKLAQPFSAKASKWVKGRSNLFSNLRQAITTDDSWIWIHVASLGEFEQGRPLIEQIKQSHPEKRILLTFFSPSGYEIRSKYKGADYVSYIPLDTVINARQFLDIVNPCLSVFVKYDFWFCHLQEMLSRKMPVLVVSAQFRPGQIYFQWLGRKLLPVLKSLEQIFVVDTDSENLLKEQDFDNVSRCGDTRVDRVIQVASKHRDFSFVKQALGTERILVAGSTWPEDFKRILPLINKSEIKCVLAPHEIEDQKLRKIEKQIDVPTIRLSQVSSSDTSTYSVVLVDTMGDLADIYHIGKIAYIGGGFGSGIHNILEPVAHELPVIFGPRYGSFSEAKDLIELGVCVSIQSTSDIQQAIKVFSNTGTHNQITTRAKQYLNQHAGATASIYDYIREENLLGNGLDKTVS